MDSQSSDHGALDDHGARSLTQQFARPRRARSSKFPGHARSFCDAPPPAPWASRSARARRRRCADRPLEHAPLLRRPPEAETPPQRRPRVARARARLRDARPQASSRVDRVTGAVRFLGRTDGYLTGPAARRRRARSRCAGPRTHLDAPRARRAADLAGPAPRRPRTARRYGVTRLIFQQTYRGVPALDSTLRVNVASDGRVVNVGGRPRTGLRVGARPELPDAGRARSGRRGRRQSPPMLRVAAATRTRGDPLPRSPQLRDYARLDRRRAARAWPGACGSRSPTDAVWHVVVDAGHRRADPPRQPGQVRRQRASPGTTTRARPAAARRARSTSPAGSTSPDRLRGNFTHVYNDADNTEDCTTDIVDPTQPTLGDIVTPDEEIRPRGIVDGDWVYEYTPIPSPAGNCPAGRLRLEPPRQRLLARQPRPGRHAGLLLRQHASPSTSRRRRSASTRPPATSSSSNTTGSGKGNDGIYASTMDAGGQAAGRPIPRALRPTTRTCSRAPTAVRRGCRCTCSSRSGGARCSTTRSPTSPAAATRPSSTTSSRTACRTG